jgi:serine protease inhibitor
MKAKTIVVRVAILAGCVLGLAVIPGLACGGGKSGIVISDPGPLPSRGSAQGHTAQAKALAQPLSKFGLALLLRQAKATQGNVVFSPVSLACVLSMIRDGAQGQTRQELTKVLGLGGLTNEEVDQGWADLITAAQSGKYAAVTICNSLWVRKGIPFNADFLTTTRDYYAADCLPLNDNLGAAVKEINRWVYERTSGKIPKLFDGIDPFTYLVAVNTVNLKVGWNIFQETATKPAPFAVAPHVHKNVPMMQGIITAKSGGTSALVSNDFEAVCLPTNGPVDVWVAVPNGKHTPEDIVRTLARHGGVPMLYRRASQYHKVYVDLPRFAFSYGPSDDDLKGDLMAMGIRRLFDPSANLQGIAATKGPFYCTRIGQKARIQVDEKGVEAQAASGSQMGCGAAGPLIVDANRPFLVVLTESGSRAPLFLAIVRDPQ